MTVCRPTTRGARQYLFTSASAMPARHLRPLDCNQFRRCFLTCTTKSYSLPAVACSTRTVPRTSAQPAKDRRPAQRCAPVSGVPSCSCSCPFKRQGLCRVPGSRGSSTAALSRDTERSGEAGRRRFGWQGQLGNPNEQRFRSNVSRPFAG